MPEQPILPSPRLPKEQILKLLREISGVEVVWSTGARGLLGYQPSSERAWLLANVQGWRELGTDELRVVWNPVRNANDEMLVGQRTFTLALQAFSVDPEIEAFDLLERVRFRMRTQEARALMVPTLALRDFQDVRQLPPMESQQGSMSHIVLRASMDVRMNCVVGADPQDPSGGGIIATAPLPVIAIDGPTGPGTGNLIP